MDKLVTKIPENKIKTWNRRKIISRFASWQNYIRNKFILHILQKKKVENICEDEVGWPSQVRVICLMLKKNVYILAFTSYPINCCWWKNRLYNVWGDNRVDYRILTIKNNKFNLMILAQSQLEIEKRIFKLAAISACHNLWFWLPPVPVT